MSVVDIARPEIRELRAYVAARQVQDTVRLNANESPESPWAHLDRTPLNRYPEVRPATLQRRMAGLYGVDPDNVLATRGSTEGIDTLVRTFCRAYRDNVVVTPPTFDMYKVYADVQAVALNPVPLDAARDFAFDADAVLAAADDCTRLIFVCSPNNPTGGLVDAADILRIVEARRDRSVVVVDEAYVEFSGADSLAQAVSDHDNLAVLRTMSKAFALAGARCGALIGCAELVSMLGRVLSPYSFSTPVTERVLDAMADDGFEKAARLVERTARERDRVAAALDSLPAVERVWPSRANFLLVRFDDADRASAALEAERVLVRRFPDRPELDGCARITIGTPAENDLMLAALETL